MSVSRIFTLCPLSRLVKLTVLLPITLCSAPSLGALEPISGDTVIDASTPLTGYQLFPGATLTANGARTEQIRAGTDSTVTLNASTVTATSLDAIQMSAGSRLIIGAGSEVSSDIRGLVLTRDGAVGSSATVTGSTIRGGLRAVSVSGNSTLDLRDSHLIGTGANSYGLEMFGGTVSASGGSISGGKSGVLIRYDSALPQAGNLTLDGTRVEGRDGAAIQVGIGAGQGATADIVVRNGSTLVGSDGVMLRVAADSTANMQVDNSDLVGDVVAEDGGTANLTLQNRATLTGRLENVKTLAINSDAQWNMIEDSQLGDLSLNGGVIKFGDPRAFHTLTVDNLSGNGLFIMDTDFATGETDFLNITGTAEGNHELLVGSSGADPLTDGRIQVVHAANGDAVFSLLNGRVDLGTFSYGLVQDANGQDWYLDASRKVISPGTETVLALFDAGPTVWYGELSSLRSRMGEVRANGGQAGGWMRSYGNKYDVSASSGVAYAQNQQGISLGADAPLPWGDGQWLIGVLAGYSKSDLNFSRGSSGTVDSYYAGVYTTWLDTRSGYYFDGVVKFNRLDNDADVLLSDGVRSKGDYSDHGLGASLEFGRHISLSDGYFVEPFTQLSGLVIQGKDYDLDNGMHAEGGAARSVLAKAGTTAGRRFDLGEGRMAQPYVKLAVAHEFINDNKVDVNEHRFRNDLSGSRGELGAGIAVSMNERLQLHADFEYSNGEHIEQPWGANFGLRYTW